MINPQTGLDSNMCKSDGFNHCVFQKIEHRHICIACGKTR